jgi:hypothetical protein
MELYEIEKEQWEAEKEKARKEERPAPEKPEKPTEHRYMTSDATHEKLGVILSENPNGILLHRDELISLLRDLDKEEHCAARGFYISAWNGDGSYTFDRIQRGTTHVNHMCLNLLGATTPNSISKYIRSVSEDGDGGDGLIQRFGLMIWPDINSKWRNVDEYPNREAREKAGKCRPVGSAEPLGHRSRIGPRGNTLLPVHGRG